MRYRGNWRSTAFNGPSRPVRNAGCGWPSYLSMGLWLAIMAMQQSPDVGQPQPNVGSMDIERASGRYAAFYIQTTVRLWLTSLAVTSRNQQINVERRTGLRLKPSAVWNKIQQMLYFVDTLQAFASFCNIFMLFIYCHIHFAVGLTTGFNKLTNIKM